MTSDKSVTLDDELLELFGPEPELLAIVDALSATQRRRRRIVSRGRVLALVAAAVMAATAALVVGGNSHASVITRALAELPPDRVIHLSLRYADHSRTLIDTRSGATAPVVHVFDEWYDSNAGIRRVRDTVAGVPVADVRLRARGQAGFASTALTAFPSLYRQGLSRASTAHVTNGRISGQPVYWIHFDGSPLVRVAIKQESFRPILVVFRGGDVNRRFTITRFGWLPQGADVPAADEVDRNGGIYDGRPMPELSAAADDSLAFQALDGKVDGLRGKLLKRLSIAGSPAYDLLFARGLGQREGDFVEVQESSAPARAFGWTLERVVLAKRRALSEVDGDAESVYTRIGGRWFHIVAPHKKRLAVRVIRMLRTAALDRPNS